MSWSFLVDRLAGLHSTSLSTSYEMSIGVKAAGKPRNAAEATPMEFHTVRPAWNGKGLAGWARALFAASAVLVAAILQPSAASARDLVVYGEPTLEPALNAVGSVTRESFRRAAYLAGQSVLVPAAPMETGI